MDYLEHLKSIPDMYVGCHDFHGNLVISVTGPHRLVLAVLRPLFLTGAITPDQFIQMGIGQQDQQLHLVFYAVPGQEVSHIDSAELTRRAFHYVHLLAAMARGVHVAVFDPGFVPTAHTRVILETFSADMFSANRTVDHQGTTMLFLGRRSANRVLVAFQTGFHVSASVQVIPQLFIGDTCYTTCGNHTLLANGRNTSAVAGLHVTDVEMLMTKPSFVPVWKTYGVEGLCIEDMSVSIADTSVMLATVRNTQQRMIMPVRHCWGKEHRNMSLVFVRALAAVVHHDHEPIVRLDPISGMVYTVGGTDHSRLAIRGLNSYDPKTRAQLTRIVEDIMSSKKVVLAKN